METLAKKLSLSVVLVRVIQTMDVYPPLAGGAAVPADGGAMYAGQIAEETAGEDAERYLEKVAARLNSRGVAVSWEVMRGDIPARGIAALSDNASGNMIALASHTRSGITRWVLGSVAEDLVRETGDPVLIIPAQAVDEG